jgi:hypothetical protein
MVIFALFAYWGGPGYLENTPNHLCINRIRTDLSAIENGNAAFGRFPLIKGGRGYRRRR